MESALVRVLLGGVLPPPPQHEQCSAEMFFEIGGGSGGIAGGSCKTSQRSIMEPSPQSCSGQMEQQNTCVEIIIKENK